MNHRFDRDLAVIGAGHIGLPWAAVLAAEGDRTVTCLDIDEERVDTINAAEAPFDEPELDELLARATREGRLEATADVSVIADHKYVASTVNAPRHRMHEFLNVISEYATHLTDDHVFINRTTLPVDMVDQTAATLAAHSGADPAFTVFPERLAEGSAIAEIRTLPKIVGTADERGRTAMEELLAPLGGELLFTDPETAIFVKLIDNSYRDALFAISNQIALTADELALNGKRAIELANHDYPRNDIPTPGTVGGKCLPKDPHFLMDETVCDQPSTPDLFSASRKTNASLPSYIVTEILKKRPSKVALLGLAYKPDIDDTFNSPAADICDRLASQGVHVEAHDPHLDGNDHSLTRVLSDADVVLYAVDHTAYRGVERDINDCADPNGEVYDVWGALDPSALDLDYDGFGITLDPSG